MSSYRILRNKVEEAIPEDNEDALAALEELLDNVKHQGYEQGYDAAYEEMDKEPPDEGDDEEDTELEFDE